MGALEGIEPREIWHWFQEICRIPRPSGHEDRIADYLEEFARERDLEYLRDDVNNVLIRKPQFGGGAPRPPLAFQAHVDIVPEKRDGSGHDFLKDPVSPAVIDGWVVSEETTLGADNGIGVSIMLALLDSVDIHHPELECLFTTDEERGLTGASNLDPGWLASRRMVNLDSEDDGSFTIGCAGGLDLHLSADLGAGENAPCRSLTVAGLKGGHSGIEIHKSRGNAIRILARLLRNLCGGLGCRIASIDGGSKRNAIPRTAKAMVYVPEEVLERAREMVRKVQGELEAEFAGIEESITISIGDEIMDNPSLGTDSSLKVADILLALPHGVMKYSGVIDGLVETSVNLAVAGLSEGSLNVELSVRSPLESSKRALAERVEAVAELSGCYFHSGGGYPGWMPDAGSKLLEQAAGIYREIFGREPLVESIHAGLECGIIGDRVGGMDMISIGPNIRDVHVPGERVEIESMERFWKFMIALVEKLD